MDILLAISVIANVAAVVVCLRMHKTYTWWEGRVRHLEEYVENLRDQVDDFYKEEIVQQIQVGNINEESRQVGDAVAALLGDEGDQD